MEKTMDDPPMSAVLLDHCSFSQEHFSYSQVQFNNVEKFYVPGGDVMCYYTITPQYTPHRKDWIGIFKVGWKTTREYYTFMWVTLPEGLNKDSSKEQEVKFKAYYLPKDDEHYQFCYVDRDGVVRGASTPFQFREETENDIVVVTTKERVEEIEQLNDELYQENQILKSTCANLQKMLAEVQAELQMKQEEFRALDCTYKGLEQDVEKQKVYWEKELLQQKEYNQKIASEKETMEIEVKKLQTQLSSQKSEMENLAQRDQEKTKQLECLKKENSQLCQSLAEQKEQQKTVEQTLEKMKEKETAMRKKHQELKDENFDMSKKLKDGKIDNDVTQRETGRLKKEIAFLKKERERLLGFLTTQEVKRFSLHRPPQQEAAMQNSGLVFGNPYTDPLEEELRQLIDQEMSGPITRVSRF